MSRKQRKEKSLFLFVAIYFYSFRACHLASLGQREAGLWWINQDNDVRQGNWRLVELDTRGPDLNKPKELHPESAAVLGELLPYFSVPNLGDSDFELDSLSWTNGGSRRSRSSALKSQDGYQADFKGHGVQGKVLGPSLYSSPHFSEWLAMRPLVLCDDDVMTFTASGEGFTHLFVDRKGSPPISLFQLPSYCGYSVRSSLRDLEMMVPFDACYITQENGSYVLPMLWLGSPLKLSCPAQIASPAPSFSPSVFCSSYGMAVQMEGQEPDIMVLGVLVNGGWGPFVAEECARHVPSKPGQLAFFISSAAPCLSIEDGLHLHFIFDDKEFILSCPVSPQFPYAPSPPAFPLSPGEPQFPHIPDPVGTVPSTPPLPPPQPPTQEQISHLPEYPYYLLPGFQYPQLPQVYPPGPQPAQQQQQQSLNFMGPYSYGDPPKYPPPPHQLPVVVQAPSFPKPGQVQDGSPNQISKLPVGPPHYASSVYYPSGPLYNHAFTPAPTLAGIKTNTAPPATQPPKPPSSPYDPQYYLQMSYYPAPTAAPVAQAPAPLPYNPILAPVPITPLEQPVGPQYPVNPFYPPAAYSTYYHYGQFPFPNAGIAVQFPSASHPSPPLTTTTTRMMGPEKPGSPTYPVGHFYPERPIYFPLSTPPSPGIEKPQKPAAPQTICLPYTQTICGYYHPLYPPLYPSPYTQYAQTPVTTKKPFTTTTPTTTTATTSSITSIPTGPPPQNPHVQCWTGTMFAFLPFAHPDSIQVRDRMKRWLFLSTVSPLCGYMLQTVLEESGVILHSPLPACHSEQLSPMTLPLRFWDLSMSQYRTLDLECPDQTTPETPAPVTPSVSPTPPSTTRGKVSPPAIPKPKLMCSSHKMTVELPAGPVSEIVVKDIIGNQMNLQDAPKDCGYSAMSGKDGKIHLSLQLHSRCHMSVQGKTYVITVVYMTESGRQEAQFFCPVLIPGSEQECNLPSEQRLPCGPGSLSQPQCLSMGCCFSKQPPACYYPMDACTIDRHFVFSVPASLTEPPLSPAMLLTSGNSTCKPERVTSEYALFKIPMDGCGTHRVMVGKTVIYMVEVINKVQAISLNYGTITRDSPVRVLVECRYLPSSVLSVSYMVKTPSLGPAVNTQGVFGVQLRIAKDAQYSSYYPQYHQPLQMLLGKPLYLEVRLLNNPDPSLVLLVHYCVAYPRSGKAVWLLLYNGCPNPLDPAPQQAVLFNPRPPSPQGQTRRFTISTFQFLPDGELKDSNEEIYFMCSTEICSPRDGPCVEGCFGQ